MEKLYKKDNNNDYYLSFILNRENFAINVPLVLEVLKIKKIVKVPLTPKHLKGLINLRGDVIPVIDMRTKFNFPEEVGKKEKIIIVIELITIKKTIRIGAIVDSVENVLNIKKNEIENAPDASSNYDNTFIKGMKKVGENFIMILNHYKIFAKELKNVKDK